MGTRKLNLSDITKLIVIIAFIITIMHLGKVIFIPLAFAVFIAFLLLPLCSFFEKYISHVLSIIVTYLIIFIVIGAGIYFFSNKVITLFENVKDFGSNLQNLINQYISLIDKELLGKDIKLDGIIPKNNDSLISSSRLVGKTITISSSLLAYTGLTLVYTFLFLLYRTSFKNFILNHFPEEKREHGEFLLKKIQKVSKNYLFGLLIVMILLGVLNGTGLWIIGLNYPFMFGFFAAILAIIPYIGTFTGGLLPVTYALAIQGNLVLALLVLGWYSIVQVLENNILTPKIVGDKVSLNPLFALISLIAGSVIWGVAGMILFIPIMAVVKVIFDNIEPLKPYGRLLGSDFGKN